MGEIERLLSCKAEADVDGRSELPGSDDADSEGDADDELPKVGCSTGSCEFADCDSEAVAPMPATAPGVVM